MLLQLFKVKNPNPNKFFMFGRFIEGISNVNMVLSKSSVNPYRNDGFPSPKFQPRKAAKVQAENTSFILPKFKLKKAS